jgi:hypothetical protein
MFAIKDGAMDNVLNCDSYIDIHRRKRIDVRGSGCIDPRFLYLDTRLR